MRIFILFTFVFVTSSAIGITEKTQIEKIASFCKVWGFLKYYHPEAAKGNIDWDREFMKRYQEILILETKEETSKYYITWINGLGTLPSKKTKELDEYKILPDNNWMKNGYFTNELTETFELIQRNRNKKKNYYLDFRSNLLNMEFKNEKPYNDSVFPSEQMRLLGLARYWNIIHYFFPYKHLMDQNWNDALVEMIPKFRFAKDTVEYHLAMLEVTTKLNDSHTQFGTLYTRKYFGTKWVPFHFTLIDYKAVVVSFFNDSLCKKYDIQIGDVCLKIDDRTIKEILEERTPYINFSNESVRMRNSYHAIFTGNSDSVKITYERDENIHEKMVGRYDFRSFHYNPGEDTSRSWKIISDNIGYVNMGTLIREDVPSMMDELKNTKAIIFDIRNYPNETIYDIAVYLIPDAIPYAKFTMPDRKYPGAFFETSALNAGRGIKNYNYTGKIIYLFNEETQSHAEITVMIMQTIPNSIGIGSQSAGADGNVSSLYFPGGYRTRFTGVGVYYPDGRETQRIGMKPDIEVRPSIKGIREGRDEVLEKAIEVMRK